MNRFKISSTMSLRRMYLFLSIIMLMVGYSQRAFPQSIQTVKVRVVEADTREPVPGAVVRARKDVFTTDLSGECNIPLGAADTIVLSVRSLGFKEIVARSYPVKGKVVVVALAPSVHALETVNVDAQRRHTSVLQQTSVVSAKDLEKGSALSLARLLEKVPGVSSISSGNSIAKPVIQGMHSSRILLVNDGVRLESQSWGLDHAPEIDHTASSVVEVIKGAESIRYGYGAVGGVVLLNQASLPYGHDKLKVKGLFNSGYSTNSRAYDGAGTVEAGYKQFGARAHAMYQRAGDYSTARYVLNNTGYKNISFSGVLGFQSKKITATLAASLYYSRSGIYYGSKLSDVDQLLTRFQIGRPEENTIRPFSYTMEPPFQQSQHLTLKGDVKWNLSSKHNLLLNFSFQENLREEFENRKVAKISWLPVQDLRLTTYNTEAIWTADWKQGMNSQFGLSVMQQTNYNVPGTKQPAFIPNFAALTTGFFLLHKMTFGKLVCSAGMRYDMRGLDVNGYTSLSSFKYYDDFKVYSNFTGNVAAHYQFNDNLDARINLGWAWRPPDVNELYANGLHHGSYWVVGNNELTSERGYKAVMGARYRTAHILVEPSCFFQQITNYIYDNIGTGNDRFHNHPSGKYPKFIYGQDNARLMGGDLVVTVKPLQQLSVSAKGEWIYARNLSQGGWLPFMPSDRYGLSGEYQLKLGSRRKWDLSLQLESSYVTRQTRFDPTKDLVPEAPPAYFLLGGTAEVATAFDNGHKLKVLLVGDNILNRQYKEYTDRFRYYAHARGAQFTFRTIYAF